jgi:hypothetical protein
VEDAIVLVKPGAARSAVVTGAGASDVVEVSASISEEADEEAVL